MHVLLSMYGALAAELVAALFYFVATGMTGGRR